MLPLGRRNCCIAKNLASQAALRLPVDYACGIKGADWLKWVSLGAEMVVGFRAKMVVGFGAEMGAAMGRIALKCYWSSVKGWPMIVEDAKCTTTDDDSIKADGTTLEDSAASILASLSYKEALADNDEPHLIWM
ncbi:hypothetical protein Tco_0997627 [Tanacetum coccineum]